MTGSWYYQRYSTECNYPVGYDPVWGLTTEYLTYSNSIKMKMAVIFGVIHMSMGILIKGTNSVYFKRWPDLVFEVIIGLIILLGLFGFMDVLIFLKWFHELNIDDTAESMTIKGYMTDEKNPGEEIYKLSGDDANERMPSIITIMINIVFKFGYQSPEDTTYYTHLIGKQSDYPAKEYTIGFALLIIVVCVIPFMLFAKPCCFRQKGPPEEDNEIEFTNIRGDDMSQNLINPSMQRGSDGDGAMSDDVMAAR